MKQIDQRWSQAFTLQILKITLIRLLKFSVYYYLIYQIQNCINKQRYSLTQIITEQLYTSILNSYTSSLLAEIEIKFPTGRKEKYLIGAQIYQTRLMKTKYKNKFKLQIIVHQFFQTQIAFYIMTIGSVNEFEGLQNTLLNSQRREFQNQIKHQLTFIQTWQFRMMKLIDFIKKVVSIKLEQRKITIILKINNLMHIYISGYLIELIFNYLLLIQSNIKKIIHRKNMDLEIDFIRRKYHWHLILIILTFSFIALILVLDIRCVFIDSQLEYLTYTILEIIFCLLIFLLAILELRYFYQVKINNFSFTYSSIISQQFLNIIIVCLIMIYITNFVFMILYAIDVIYKQSTHDCHYFGITDEQIEIVITVIIILGQMLMMHIPLKIRKTLYLLSNQQQNLLKNIIVEGDFDIAPENGEFRIVKVEKQQQELLIPSSQINRFYCKICISQIKNKQIIVKLSCSHIFHQQCFNKYAQSMMKQQSFILNCKICQQVVDLDKQQIFVIKEIKSRVLFKE